MKAIEIEKTNSDLEQAIRSLRVVEKPIPEPGPGQVLIKMEAATCNPSDLLFLQGRYGVQKTFPAVPGWEGAGRVVKSGGGLLGWWLSGKRVACGGQADRDGTWAEYYVTEAKSCIPLDDAVPFEQGATLIINPLTAVGLVEKAIAKRHEAIIQTAACSQVGRMVQTLARQKHIPLINIVRREEQAEQLREAGEEHIFNSQDSDFDEKVKEAAKSMRATVAFDAVAGVMTGRLLALMPNESKVLVYGALSERPCGDISPLNLIFEKKKVEGFWLSEWIRRSGFFHTMQATRKVQRLIKSGNFETKIRRKATLDQWPEALSDYQKKMTDGKVILEFS